jgi:YggT family protein
MLSTLIDVYSAVVVVAVVLSWVSVDPRNQFATVIRSLTQPVLDPIRRLIPPIGGLDLSPMVLLIALQLLKGLV